MATEFSPRDTESNHDSTSPSEFVSFKRRCCFCIPYRWQKVRSSSPDYNSDKTLWSRGIDALMKIREWSEIVAGPKWKTFIRRFNRNKSFNQKSTKFQYDPLDYALNFDEGALDNGDSEMENDYMVRNFSSRYASRTTIPITSKAPNEVSPTIYDVSRYQLFNRFLLAAAFFSATLFLHQSYLLKQALWVGARGYASILLTSMSMLKTMWLLKLLKTMGLLKLNVFNQILKKVSLLKSSEFEIAANEQGAPKKVRGYTQKAETWNMDSTQKIVVTFNKFGKPVGDEGN